jgi:hypothetical protein
LADITSTVSTTTTTTTTVTHHAAKSPRDATAEKSTKSSKTPRGDAAGAAKAVTSTTAAVHAATKSTTSGFSATDTLDELSLSLPALDMTKLKNYAKVSTLSKASPGSAEEDIYVSVLVARAFSLQSARCSGATVSSGGGASTSLASAEDSDEIR